MSLIRLAVRLSSASASSFGEALLRFARTVVLSRLLSPHDLGGAVALIAVLSACEVLADVGLDKFIMVSRGEDRAQVVVVARQMTICRAILLAAVFALAAPLFASAFGAGDERGLIVWLGVVPLVGSLRNWRVVQLQLDYRYAPEMITNLGGRLAGLAVLPIAAMLVRDARLVLANLVVEAAVTVLLSYILAPRERATVIDPAIRRAALRFGLPLMANGIGLVALRQFDQAIVSNLFGLAGLAQYALALNLAIVPMSAMQEVGAKIAFPFLSRSDDTSAGLAQASLIVVTGMVIAGAALAVPLGLGLDQLVPLIYGPAYQVSTAFAALAMLAAFVRFSRGGLNLILLQHSQTTRVTAGNLITGVGLLIGLLLALEFRRRESVLVGVVIGDLLSFILSTALLRPYLSAATVWRHSAILASAVTASAMVLWLHGSAALIGFSGGQIGGHDAIDWRMRGIALACGLLVIGADAWLIHRHVLNPFLQASNRRPVAPVSALPRPRQSAFRWTASR